MSNPLAYFLTFTTYGSWLHGDSRGSVERAENQFGDDRSAKNELIESKRRNRLRQSPYLLDEPRRETVLAAIKEVARHRDWRLWASHVRTNHVHAVVTSPVPPERVMSDFKSWSSRAIRERFAESADRDRWTQHGSTRYLYHTEDVISAVSYVWGEQGDPLQRFLNPAVDWIEQKPG